MKLLCISYIMLKKIILGYLLKRFSMIFKFIETHPCHTISHRWGTFFNYTLAILHLLCRHSMFAWWFHPLHIIYIYSDLVWFVFFHHLNNPGMGNQCHVICLWPAMQVYKWTLRGTVWKKLPKRLTHRCSKCSYWLKLWKKTFPTPAMIEFIDAE